MDDMDKWIAKQERMYAMLKLKMSADMKQRLATEREQAKKEARYAHIAKALGL